MAAERKSGSNLGRPLIDWNAAFLYYAALPLDERTYHAVADHYRVSVRTVERHGRGERWKERAAAVDQQAHAAAAAALAEERAAKLADVEKLIDATYLSYANQLRDGRVRVSAADLPRLHKLRGEIWNDPTLDTAEVIEPVAPLNRRDPIEHKLEVLRALRDAGVLQQPHEDSTQERQAEADRRDSGEAH
jgi:hypothetical protein